MHLREFTKGQISKQLNLLPEIQSTAVNVICRRRALQLISAGVSASIVSCIPNYNYNEILAGSNGTVSSYTPDSTGKVFLDLNNIVGLDSVGDALNIEVTSITEQIECQEGVGTKSPIIVVRTGSNSFFVALNKCTHAGGRPNFVSTDSTLLCPCHGSKFDTNSGAVINGPALSPLTVYASGFDSTTKILTIANLPV